VVGTPTGTTVKLDELARKMDKVRADLLTIQVDSEYEIASMLMLGEQDVDDLVAGAPIHTDDHPILEFSDMELYMMVDVEPNLGGLLQYQKEDLGQYFIGTDGQLLTLDQHFTEARRNFRNYVRRYERAHRAEID
jgi:hypothetical protein